MCSKARLQTDDDYDMMVRALSECGVDIRTITGETDGGLVTMPGSRVLFINNRSTLGQKKECCLHALRILSAEQAHMTPRIRQLLGEEDWK